MSEINLTQDGNGQWKVDRSPLGHTEKLRTYCYMGWDELVDVLSNHYDTPDDMKTFRVSINEGGVEVGFEEK